MIKHLYIFRHGETDYNKENRTMGWLDIPLNDKGISQAKDLAKVIKPINLDIIFSSPLSRCLETAKIVAESANTKIITNDDLRERSFGVFENHLVWLTDDPSKVSLDLSQDRIVLLASDMKNPNFAPENGESYNDLKHRALAAVIDIAKNSEHKNIGISAHGGVARVLLSQFTDFPFGGMPNAGYIKLDWDGTALSLNEHPEWFLPFLTPNGVAGN